MHAIIFDCLQFMRRWRGVVFDRWFQFAPDSRVGTTLDTCENLMRIVNMIHRCLLGVNSASRAPAAVDARFTKSPP